MEIRNEDLRVWSNAAMADYGPPPIMKEFTKKNPELETLEDYSINFSEEYWSKWTKVLPTGKANSWINVEEMEKIAEEIGYRDPKLDRAGTWLREGVLLGCNDPDARLRTEGKNSSLAHKLGVRVSDSLQSAIKQGYICGPLTMEELEAVKIYDPKIIPLSCRLDKANEWN